MKMKRFSTHQLIDMSVALVIWFVVFARFAQYIPMVKAVMVSLAITTSVFLFYWCLKTYLTQILKRFKTQGGRH